MKYIVLEAPWKNGKTVAIQLFENGTAYGDVERRFNPRPEGDEIVACSPIWIAHFQNILYAGFEELGVSPNPITIWRRYNPALASCDAA